MILPSAFMISVSDSKNTSQRLRIDPTFTWIMSPVKNDTFHTCQEATMYFKLVSQVWWKTPVPTLLCIYVSDGICCCLSSRQRPLPFPNDFVSEEVVIWLLWALIRLECLIRVTPPGLRQETGQCMCGGREELCTVRLRARWTVCVWVFTLVSTPKLWPGTNRVTAHQKKGLEILLSGHLTASDSNWKCA